MTELNEKLKHMDKNFETTKKVNCDTNRLSPISKIRGFVSDKISARSDSSSSTSSGFIWKLCWSSIVDLLYQIKTETYATQQKTAAITD